MGRPTIRPTFESGTIGVDRPATPIALPLYYSALSSGSTFSLKRRILASAFSMGMPA